MAASNYERASVLIRKGAADLGVVLPSSAADPILHLLMAQISYKTGDRLGAYTCAKFAISQLVGSDKSESGYSEAEIAYLRYYTKMVLLQLSPSRVAGATQLAMTIAETYRNLKPKSVRVSIRAKLPIDPKNGFEFDEYVSKQLSGQ